MKPYLLMLIAILIIFSGCTQTGEIINKTVSDNFTEPDLNETESEVTENITQKPGPEEPADLCAGVVCGKTITTCPDGFVSTCTNPCDTETGGCLPCKPDCTGHEKTEQEECDLECDFTKCEVLDEEECECKITLFCDGNGICEPGEYPNSKDCPECDDGDPCTQNSYDYDMSFCVYETIIPCCGNMECEDGEDEGSCPEDCLEEQVGDVRITALNETEEWVGLEGYNVIMSNWTLSDWKEKHMYVFPDWFMINGKVKLHKGYGEDNETDFFWQKNYYVWNNDGDNATLRDENGEIVDFYNYP